MDSDVSEKRKSELFVNISEIVLKREILRSEYTRLNRELEVSKAQSNKVTDIENID